MKRTKVSEENVSGNVSQTDMSLFLLTCQKDRHGSSMFHMQMRLIRINDCPHLTRDRRERRPEERNDLRKKEASQ